MYVVKSGTDHVVAEFKVDAEGNRVRDDLEQHPRTLRRLNRQLKTGLLILAVLLAFVTLAWNLY